MQDNLKDPKKPNFFSSLLVRLTSPQLTDLHLFWQVERIVFFHQPFMVPEILNNGLVIWEKSTVIYRDILVQFGNIDN